MQLEPVPAQECPLPDSSEINQALKSFSGLPGSGSTPTLSDHHFTCLAVVAQDLYSSLSVAVKFTRLGQGSTTYTAQFQMVCGIVGGNSIYFLDPTESLEPNVPEEVFNTETRRDCSACKRNGTDQSANCVGKAGIDRKSMHVIKSVMLSTYIFRVFRNVSGYWDGFMQEQQHKRLLSLL